MLALCHLQAMMHVNELVKRLRLMQCTRNKAPVELERSVEGSEETSEGEKRELRMVLADERALEVCKCLSSLYFDWLRIFATLQTAFQSFPESNHGGTNLSPTSFFLIIFIRSARILFPIVVESARILLWTWHASAPTPPNLLFTSALHVSYSRVKNTRIGALVRVVGIGAIGTRRASPFEAMIINRTACSASCPFRRACAATQP